MIGTGYYLPSALATNADFAKIVDTNDEWITSRTGIKSRRVETELLTWQMGAEAAKMAVKNAGIAFEGIDLVIATTVTADYLTPSMACLVANELGLANPACFDINCACAGFVAAVDMAKQYLNSGSRKTALIVSSEMLTKITDYTDRATCVLFGDGAGAVLLQSSDTLYSCDMGSEPSGTCHLFARGVSPNNQFRNTPFDWATDGFAATNGHALHQNGREVYKWATRAMPAAVKKACEKAGVQPEELKFIFPHQANLRIIETAAKNLKLPLDHFYLNISDHGNMSSACIPICLAEAEEKGLLLRGDKLCIVGFGGGLVYAACVFEW